MHRLPALAALAVAVAVLANLCTSANAAVGSGSSGSASSSKESAGYSYLVGIGKADMTGPCVEINPMGYSMPDQIARGIHTRLFARAFIFADPSKPTQRVVFVNIDAAMASQLLTMRVLEKLKAEFGGLYTRHNVAISGTHTHASPGGFLQYLAYSLSALGFIRQSFDAMEDGIMESIRKAHADLRPASVSTAKGDLLHASINRSPTAYAANPPEERAKYAHDTDKTMVMLRIYEEPTSDGRAAPSKGRSPKERAAAAASPAAGPPRGAAAEGARGAAATAAAEAAPFIGPLRPGSARGRSLLLADPPAPAPPQPPRGRGLLNWFAVHPVSMNNTNPYISGDNKGAAEQFTEKWAEKQPGLGPGFVAAFAQSSVGDTTPNVQGAYCLDSGLPCDLVHSTCNGRNALCWGKGPAWPDDVKSTKIIGRRQSDKARELWSSPGTPVAGPIDSRHVYVDMSRVEVKKSKWTEEGRTCNPAMGFSFAAGTTDGPGAYFFVQGDRNGTAFWRLVRDFIKKPTREEEDCHAPKPIILNTGDMNIPYPWIPKVVDVSLLRIGNFVIVCVPGEFTTMSGRRILAAVKETVGAAWGPNLQVVLAGLTGTYASYVTTPEEYAVQRYEGGFTLYGPHTLGAYIQTATALAGEMLSGAPPREPPPVTPPDLMSRQISLNPPVVLDTVPLAAAFGDVVADAVGVYRPGEVVEVTFRAGNPRNDLRRNGTYLMVQRLEEEKLGWADVADDDDWSTKFYWEKHWRVSSHSFATVRWEVPADAPAGTYRIQHYGSYKTLWAGVRPYQGTSGQFVVARDEATYGALAARFAALSRALSIDAIPEAVTGAAGALQVRLASLANARASLPHGAAPGAGPPRQQPPGPKWWRGEGGGDGDGGEGCANDSCVQHGPGGLRAARARSVHRRCPEWWRRDGTVKCSLLGGQGDVSVRVD